MGSDEVSSASAQPAGGSGKPTASLEELLQQRARAAIEGAKLRNVERETRRSVDEYVHRIFRRAAANLGWIEDERRERERLRKKSAAAVILWDGVEKPNRRRERRKEMRSRSGTVDYEEVPGGGQFLMMLLKKNQTGQPDLGQDDVLDDDEDDDELGERRRRLHSGGSGQGEDGILRSDPAILHVEGKKGGGSAGKAGRPLPQIVPPPHRGSGATAGKGKGEKAAADPWRFAPPRGVVVAPPGSAGGASPTSPGEIAVMESLLPSFMAVDGSGGNSPAAPVSKASSMIFGKLQSLMSAHEASAPPKNSSPLIPPMPGFSNIWGSPSGCGPSSTPSGGSPWGGPLPGGESNPWAPLPPSAVSSSFDGPWAAKPAAARQAPAEPQAGRGRRGGKHRSRSDDAEDNDLWDMPTRGPAASSELPEFFRDAPASQSLPEFFRDAQAPSFMDCDLGGIGGLDDDADEDDGEDDDADEILYGAGHLQGAMGT